MAKTDNNKEKITVKFACGVFARLLLKTLALKNFVQQMLLYSLDTWNFYCIMLPKNPSFELKKTLN